MKFDIPSETRTPLTKMECYMMAVSYLEATHNDDDALSDMVLSGMTKEEFITGLVLVNTALYIFLDLRTAGDDRKPVIEVLREYGHRMKAEGL